MRRALKDKLANYKIPQELKVIDSIPRNAMGKINKKSLVKDVFKTEKGKAHTNGITNGISTNGVTNGVTNGAPNGVSQEHTNGVTNGVQR